MKEFKFLNNKKTLKTVDELLSYFKELCIPHMRNGYIPRNLFKFVNSQIIDGKITTMEEIDDDITSLSQISVERYYQSIADACNYDPYEDIYIETVHNEENLPYFYLDRYCLDRYKVDPWEEDQDRNTEENEIKLFNEDK